MGTIIFLQLYRKAKLRKETWTRNIFSGVARAFPGGQVAHPDGQNEEENEKKKMRKIGKYWLKFEERMRKVELLPTLDCEAGYTPEHFDIENIVLPLQNSKV